MEPENPILKQLTTNIPSSSILTLADILPTKFKDVGFSEILVEKQ